MADNQITIVAEVVDKLTSRVQSMEKAIEKFTDSAEKGFKKSSNAFDVFKGALAADLVVKALGAAASAAKDLFDTFIVDGVRAASEQQDAINKLNVALAASGKFSRDASEEIVKFAEGLQKTTKFSDDAIISASALIQTLGKLSTDSLKDATEAALNLSAALGIDLESAATLVGKAANGNVTALQKMGLEIKKGATDAETFANALNAISGFGNVASSQINTFSGAVAQLSNIFNDLQEEFGFIVVENQTFIDIIKEVSTIIGEFSGSVGDNRQALKELVSEGIIGAIDALAALLSAADVVAQGFNLLFQAIKAPITEATAAIVAAGQALKGDFAGALDILRQGFVDAGADIDQAINQGPLQGLLDNLARVRGAAEQGFNKVKSGAESTVPPLNQSKVAVEEVSEALQKMATEGQKIAFSLLGADLQTKLAEDLTKISAAYQEGLILQSDFILAQQEAVMAFETAQADRDAQKLEKLKAQNETLKLLATEEADAKIAENNRAIAAIEAREKQNVLFQADQRKKQLEAEKKLQQAKLEAASQTFGNLATLMQTSSKELFAIGKAAAIAQAVIDAQLAIQKALASAPPPFSFILAASVGVAAAVQIAKISATKLATGIDSVPGTGTADSFPALLQPGERVVPTKTNTDLTSFLANNEGQSALLASIDAKLSQLNNRIVVNIGDKEIINEIRGALQSGRTLESLG